MDVSSDSGYPVFYSVEYPDRELDRLTTLFRPIVAIPILFVLATVTGGGSEAGEDGGAMVGLAGGLLFVPPLLMIVFRQKYPRWWFDWNLELLRFGNRVLAYLALMTDQYPSTDDPQTVRLELSYPDAGSDLNRWLPLVKWLLAIPHLIVLAFLSVAAVFAVLFVWIAILFTGRYPRSLFDFVEGVLRWHNRVIGYAFILVTDRYPPFSLQDA
jgi:hypothetical protein